MGVVTKVLNLIKKEDFISFLCVIAYKLWWVI